MGIQVLLMPDGKATNCIRTATVYQSGYTFVCRSLLSRWRDVTWCIILPGMVGVLSKKHYQEVLMLV